MQQLEALSGVRVRDQLLVRIVVELLLIHHEVALRVQRKQRRGGCGSAVEADQVAVSVVDVGVGAVQFDAVFQHDARVRELEGECRLRA